MNGGERVKEGWTEASISGGSHLKRMLEMYEELGFEVYLEEIDPKECDGCTVCYQEGGETMYRVYTRTKEI
jgi:multimeric flavodoxin WrbA